MGPGDGDDKSIRLLNRIITWDEEGIQWEGYQRHGEILVRELRLAGDSRGATAPSDKKTGQDTGFTKANGQDELKAGDLSQRPLDTSSASKCRGMVARVNHLGQDRSDIANTVKEFVKDMCNPSEASMCKIKSLGG